MAIWSYFLLFAVSLSGKKSQKKDAATIRAKKNLHKKQLFTVFRKIPESKGVTFGKDKNLMLFLSVFSVLSVYVCRNSKYNQTFIDKRVNHYFNSKLHKFELSKNSNLIHNLANKTNFKKL